MPVRSTRPGCQSSDSQPVYSEGVTLESMHVGQGQHNDRPLVYLQRHVSPTHSLSGPLLVAYLQSQSGSIAICFQKKKTTIIRPVTMSFEHNLPVHTSYYAVDDHVLDTI